MNEEPYETMNEGEPHAVADWLTGVIATAALIIGIAALAWPERASAAENLCQSYGQGWALGICWRSTECYVPPVRCPVGLEDADQAYMAGLRDGLKAGRVEI
jgi:hypothetical protein